MLGIGIFYIVRKIFLKLWIFVKCFSKVKNKKEERTLSSVAENVLFTAKSYGVLKKIINMLHYTAYIM